MTTGTWARDLLCGVLVAIAIASAAAAPIAETGGARGQVADLAAPSLDQAQRLFYSGNYEASSAMALALRTSDPENLATFELRTSALHFQLRRAMGNDRDQDRAFKACGVCPPLMEMFLEETAAGRALAKRQLTARPADETALFFLGKINLNYVWLRLGTLGQRTGWNEYWEARRSLDAVLKANPGHLRARVARAWIDYIVDTRMTPGFRWILGGGDKKRALAVMRETATSAGDPFAKTEAAFGLWDMEVREKNIPAAVEVARGLAREFPENQELVKFLAAQGK